MPGATGIAENVAAIRARLEAAGGGGITLVAVTKTHGWDAVEAAFAAGCDAVGENYVQEMVEKFAGRVPAGPVHMIGAIQSNKVRHAARLVSLWQTVDRASVIDEISRRAADGGCADLLIQVNTTAEQSKSGCTPQEIDVLRSRADAAGLSVRGLMTLGPTDGDAGATEAAFRHLRSLCDSHGLAVCSMGMSGDYEMAAACGSTMVRVGTAIFGARPPRAV
ncbi:MAG: hypothetical protein RI912_1430 [Actinomycetota bacterium]